MGAGQNKIIPVFTVDHMRKYASVYNNGRIVRFTPNLLGANIV